MKDRMVFFGVPVDKTSRVVSTSGVQIKDRVSATLTLILRKRSHRFS